MKKNCGILILLFLFFIVSCSRGNGSEEDTTGNSGAYVTIDITKTVATDFAGFGTQYNQNLYAGISSTDGITADNVGQLEAKVKTLKSQYVRIFFDSKAWLSDKDYSAATADYMDSFEKTVKLAQDAGAQTINITFWHTATPEEMPDFAIVLYNLIINKGLSAVKEITIQNEPNSTSMTMENYNQCYVMLDQSLRERGIRNRIRFVGGDLVQTNQQSWFTYMATSMNDLLAGYSIHIYWDDNDATKPYSRLNEVANIVKGLGTAKKPIYVTEYGVRGSIKTGVPSPGNLTGTTTPVSQTTESAMQNALFQVQGLNLGYSGFIRWDCYKAKYDGGTQYFSCIGSGTDGYPLYPLYYMTYLFTHTSEPGWQVVSCANKSSFVAAAMTSKDGADQTVYAVNNRNENYPCVVKGLSPGKSYNIYSFNSDGKGLLKKETSVTANEGVVSFPFKPKTVLAITTLEMTLP